MGQYTYFRPDSLEKALGLLSQYQGEVKILAGGTDLIIQMHKEMISPRVLIDITGIKELKKVVIRQEMVEIGALVTHAQLNEDKELKKLFPGLVEAAGEVGSPQIRNQATIGGNLCNGSPAADVVPVLFVLEAEAIIMNAAGTRRVKVVDLPVKPGKLALEADELITGFVIRKPQNNQSSAFVKLGKRKALAISVVNAAVNVRTNLEKNLIEDVRFAVGSVAPTTRGLKELEELIKGKEISESLFE
ncbi:MAG: xanthine dehydrogenase family protein subunit M, partial [Desulfobacterales bacterium]|nr:xanthine dehydrogenase family protein subunit M [Desulfobacterales bacterium]